LGEAKITVAELEEIVIEAFTEGENLMPTIAEQWIEQGRIEGRDALHLACAEWSGCDYLTTCDDRLIRQGERLHQAGILTLQVLNPIDLLRET
jgi:predicted nucleic acid-binding protein